MLHSGHFLWIGTGNLSCQMSDCPDVCRVTILRDFFHFCNFLLFNLSPRRAMASSLPWWQTNTQVSSQVSQSLGDHVISRETSFKSGALQTAFFLLFSIQRCLDVARKNVKEHSDDLRWLLQMVAFRPLNNIHSWSLCFKLLHEFHETCHETCLQTMLWHYNARVNSHQRWKQTRFRVCFHLWCELTSTMNVTDWQVS